MFDYKIKRGHIEALILSTYMNAHKTLPLDEIELYDDNIDFNLFKHCRCFKLVAKAIHVLHSQKQPFDEDEVLHFILKYEEINLDDFLDILCQTPVSYETMKRYIERLKIIDKEEEKERLLRLVL